MSSTIASAYVQIVPSADGVQGQLSGILDSEATQAGTSAGSKLSGALGGALKTGVAAIAALGTAAIGAGTAIVKATAGVAQYGDEIDKMSQKLGVSASFYQEWDAVLKHSGSSMDSMSATFKKLANAVQDGSKDQIAAFEQLGLSMDELKGMSTEEVFTTVITALQGMEEGTERTALATDLLGKSAMELGPLLNTTAEDTQTMIDAVNELGGVMSDDAVKNSAAFQDQLQDLQTAMGGVKNSIISELLPSITEVMGGFTSLISGTEGAREQLASGIQSLVGDLGGVFSGFTDTFNTIGGAIADVAPSILESLCQGILDSLPSIGPTIVEVIGKFADTMMTLLPMLIETGVQIIVKIAEGIAQALPTLVPTIVEVIITVINTIIENIPLIIDAANQILIGLVQGILAAIPVLIEALPTIIDTIINAIIEAIPLIIDATIQLIMAIVEALPTIIQALIDAIPRIISSLIQGLMTALPLLIEGLIQLVMAIIENLPTIILAIVEAIPQIVEAICTTLLDNFPLVLEAAIQILFALIKAIPYIIVELVKALPQIVWAIIKGLGLLIYELGKFIVELICMLGKWIADIAKKAWEGAKSLVTKVVDAVKPLIEKIGSIFSNIINKVKEFASNLLAKGKEAGMNLVTGVVEKVTGLVDKIKTVGSNVITGLWEGIKDKVGWIKDKISGFVDDVTGWFKNFFKIGSPSRVMADEVGKWLPLGFAQGIEENMGAVTDAVDDMANEALIDGQSLFGTATVNMNHSTSDLSDNTVYGLLATYLPMIAEGGNVTIKLDGDASRMFTAMREQNYKFKKLTGSSAFA